MVKIREKENRVLPKMYFMFVLLRYNCNKSKRNQACPVARIHTYFSEIFLITYQCTKLNILYILDLLTVVMFCWLWIFFFFFWKRKSVMLPLSYPVYDVSLVSVVGLLDLYMLPRQETVSHPIKDNS